ncbi:MAG TPA: hypothetical protein VHU86_04975 [Solirubrobacterales bacterium]|jgi:hypothetical protein|nr:hypothetical protein [Solirubrobacterales bacterium]
MDPFEKQERKREAQRRRRAQREKAGELRGRVVAISLVCFALLWGTVFVQMATGNDPVLGSRPTKVARPRPKVIEAEPEPVEEEFVEPEAEFEPEPEPEVFEPEPEPAPVTTSQS